MDDYEFKFLVQLDSCQARMNKYEV